MRAAPFDQHTIAAGVGAAAYRPIRQVAPNGHMSRFELFARFAPKIRRLPATRELAPDDIRVPRFRLAQAGALSVYYGPFDGWNRDARLALVGLTPGWTQMQVAYQVANDGLRAGLSPGRILARVKKQAAFAGSMRTNLIDMLDEIGIAAALGVGSAASLFETESGLVHTTSAVRYPVFVNDANYTGHAPKLWRSPVLQQFVTDLLGPELRRITGALVIPLGDMAAAGVKMVVEAGFVEPQRCLVGLPHPSGANGHRQRQFRSRRARLRRAVTAWRVAT